jgi:hypothetical protein
MRRPGTGTGFGRGDPCTQWPDFASVVGEERRLDAETRNRYRLRWREAVRGPSAKRAFARYGQDDGFWMGRFETGAGWENLRKRDLRGYDLVRYLSRPEARLEHEEMSALR